LMTLELFDAPPGHQKKPESQVKSKRRKKKSTRKTGQNHIKKLRLKLTHQRHEVAWFKKPRKIKGGGARKKEKGEHIKRGGGQNQEEHSPELYEFTYSRDLHANRILKRKK